jgi:hypothetical protein
LSEANEDQKKIVEEFDKLCLDLLREGARVVVKDAKGDIKVVTVTLPGKTLDVIRTRIKDLGVGMVPTAGTPSGNLIEAAKTRGLRFRNKEIQPSPPPLDMESDDAATG